MKISALVGVFLICICRSVDCRYMGRFPYPKRNRPNLNWDGLAVQRLKPFSQPHVYERQIYGFSPQNTLLSGAQNPDSSTTASLNADTDGDDGAESEPSRQDRSKARRNMLNIVTEHIVAFAGALTSRDECLDRLFCNFATFIPSFPWRGLIFMLLEPFLPSASSRVVSAIKAKIILNDDCTRYFCYTQSLR